MYFLIRSGQNTFSGSNLTITSATIEQDWKWLGSYENWRSLMFVYMYPENLLQPSLKPVQTAKFRELVQRTRDNLRLAPIDACRLMNEYEGHLQDITTLQLQASCQTYIEAERDGCAIAQVSSPKEVMFQFAVSKGKKTYWNNFFINGDPTTNVSSWNALPLLENTDRILNASPFTTENGERYLYVFVIVNKGGATDDKGLVALRYNLKTLAWEENLLELELPDDTLFDQVIIDERISELIIPSISGLSGRVRSKWSDEIDGEKFTPTPAYDHTLFTIPFNKSGTKLDTKNAGESQIVYLFTLKILYAIRTDNANVHYFFSCRESYKDNMKVKLCYFNKIGNDKLAIYPPDYSNYMASFPTDYAAGSWWTRLYNYFDRNSDGNGNNTKNNTNWLKELANTGSTKELICKGIISKNITGNSLDNKKYHLYFENAGGVTQYHLKYGINLPPRMYDITSNASIFYQIDANDFSGPLGNHLTIDSESGRSPYIGPCFKYPKVIANTANYWVPGFRAYHPYNPTGNQICISSTAILAPVLLLPALSVSTGTPPMSTSTPTLMSKLDADNQGKHKTAIANLFSQNNSAPKGLQAYLEEAYYYLPLHLAQELQKNKHYEEALKYFRMVYDYQLPVGDRVIAKPFDSSVNMAAMQWLQNPDNPHSVAGLRANSYTQFTLMNLVRCLTAFADQEFTRDTVESVPRAKELYELAESLLNYELGTFQFQSCEELLAQVDVLVTDVRWQPEWERLKEMLRTIDRKDLLVKLLKGYTKASIIKVAGIIELFEANGDWEAKIESVEELIENAMLDPNSVIGATIRPPRVTNIQLILNGVANRPYVPLLNGEFCIPNNPVPYSLFMYVQLSLFKIRNCRNIAGMKRDLDPYAAPTDATSGLPMIGANGRLSFPGRLVIPATPYRYPVLIERTKQLVSIAQQVENAMLSSLEKRDAEYYGQLKARQDIKTSRATVKLQDLRVAEAEDGVTLAEMQQDRSQLMQDSYQEWINAGLNDWENAMVIAYGVAGTASLVSSIMGNYLTASTANPLFVTASVGFATAKGIFDGISIAANTTAQISSIYASHERREQEWTLQRNLAQKDVQIGGQQIKLSEDRLKITGQEKAISELQLGHAEDTANFLAAKFTNADLYDWMSRVLENAYNYFLQQATAMAKVAEQQLAFERQESPQGLIQGDYWAAPSENLSYDPEAKQPADRKGLTGSTRLLQDVTKLDQYAFETNRRKLQPTKTLSLAQLFPAEFSRFRQTGRLPFGTLQAWFDRDFPGHYLRIIRRIRTSVIALVPPTEGIKATLGTTGVSRTVVNGTPLQTVSLPRPPETIAYTSPMNATGLFELEQQPGEMLYPFEGMGVEANWEFVMQPAANMMDFRTIADVLISLDYTTLDSYEHGELIKKELNADREVQMERSFSLKNNFPDQWFDLHHASDTATPYEVRFTLNREDFPRNLKELKVKSLSIFVDTEAENKMGLALSLDRGAGAQQGLTNEYGLISTRTGRAGSSVNNIYSGASASWTALFGSNADPVGTWTLAIDSAALRQQFADEKVNDLMLIVEFEGEGPAFN